MKFKEASPELVGCIAKGSMSFRNTAKLQFKSHCDTGKMGCCFFCPHLEACKTRCPFAFAVFKQPEGIQANLSCNQLQAAELLVWNFLSEGSR